MLGQGLAVRASLLSFCCSLRGSRLLYGWLAQGHIRRLLGEVPGEGEKEETGLENA